LLLGSFSYHNGIIEHSAYQFRSNIGSNMHYLFASTPWHVLGLWTGGILGQMGCPSTAQHLHGEA
jgi:hypothetical protein